MHRSSEKGEAAREVGLTEVASQPGLERSAGSEHLESKGRSFLYQSKDLKKKKSTVGGNVVGILREQFSLHRV